ncbi:MAG: hypothetical protein P1V97_32840 [Planctomycetota bacterium]|nr:hypothetical protein [Planctomycetota bacterium]
MVKRAFHSILIGSIIIGGSLVLCDEALADKVFMRDGRVMTGEVIDQGDHVKLISKLGGIRIPMKDVLRIERDKPLAPTDKEPDDIVIQTGGRILRGRATISPDGNFVWVTVRGQKVSIPRDHVREILKHGKRKTELETKGELAERIRGHIKALSSKDPDAHATARSALLKLGVFSIPLIKKIAKDLPKSDPVHPVLEAIVKEHGLKSVVSEVAESRIKNIYKRLASIDRNTRISVIKEIVLEAPKAAPNILLHFLKNDKDPEVRALCISQLSMLRCFNELAAVLKLPNGRMRLAAAIALGEHGILAGVPVLIDALEISVESYKKVLGDKDVDAKVKMKAQTQLAQLNQLRHLASLKLREFTGHNYGYEIFDNAVNQKLAIKKWRNWWIRDGKRLLAKSVKMVEGFQADSKERKESMRYWIRGGQIQSEFEALKGGDNRNLSGIERRSKFKEVAVFYQRAIQIDPTFVPARLALAYVYYSELNKLEEARAQLKSVLNQTLDVKSKLPRRTAYLYMANIARREGDFKEAELRLYDALKLVNQDRDLDFDMRLDLHLALGDLYMDWALTRRVLPRDSVVLEAGSTKKDKDGKVIKTGPKTTKKDKGKGKATEKAKSANVEKVTLHLKNAKASYERGLEEINRQDQALREEAQRLIDTKSNDLRKAALLQSLRANIKQLGVRSGAFYYGVARSGAALGFSRSAEQNFSMAARMNPKNERFRKASKYWKELIRSRDEALRKRLADEKRNGGRKK